MQKVLAHAGVASRRACEELIRAGRVTVNGRVVRELGTKVEPSVDTVAVDGCIVGTAVPVYILLNKPVGYVSTTIDPHGRPTVLDLLHGHKETRLYPVGRLDADSEGLLLLTNDGALTQRLTHPRYALEKEYLVWVKGCPDDGDLARLRTGIPLDGRPAPVDKVELMERTEGHCSSALLRIVVHEGRKREIRRLCAAIDHPVQRLQRVRLGPLLLGNLPSGATRPLTAAEVRALKGEADVTTPQCIPSVITIDGPAASGKSALGERLANKLGYLYFDTGVLYRAVAYLALQHGVDPHDEAGLARLAAQADIEVTRATVQDGRQYTVRVEGEDVTWRLRTIDVERIVSPVAAVKGVRDALRERQRSIGLAGQVVMVGRDIGTVVLPEADLKIYLTASPEERARRRCREVLARGEQADFDQILDAMRRRDAIDSERAVAPLKPADDAFVINNDDLSIEQGLARVEELIRAWGEKKAKGAGRQP